MASTSYRSQYNMRSDLKQQQGNLAGHSLWVQSVPWGHGKCFVGRYAVTFSKAHTQTHTRVHNVADTHQISVGFD